jgi:outer membrane protein assembly factor BamD|tara:strand:- start:4254 stop:5105 length:852 start_codon:yes stop_codon:yes gene_type:complete
MKIFLKIVFLLLLINLQSCSNNEKNISLIKEVDQEVEMATTYKEGLDNLNKGDTYYAAKKFLEAELLYPQSEWAPKSALMASYSYYLQNYYSEAIYNLERYIKTYPKDKNIVYAHFLLAMCYYETIENEKRDLEPLLKAKEKFELIISDFPDSDFALDARFKIDLITDILASKEMYLGRHYIKKEKWISAINRFQNVINNYENTIYIDEAIHRLVEIHYKIGLEEESRKYAKLLGYNYQSSEWYEKSYKVFNKKYKPKLAKIKKKNKKDKKKSIIQKFKKLFE